MPDDILIGPGSSAAIPDVVRRCVGTSRRLRTALVVSGGFDTRPWSASIRQAMSGLAPEWFTQHGTLRPAGVAAPAPQLRQGPPDAVLAVRARSVLDPANAAAAL